MAIVKTTDKDGNIVEVRNDMENFLTYRTTDAGDTPQHGHIIKHKPLLNKEIDANFGAIKKDLESRAPIHNPSFTGLAEFLATSAVLLPVGTTDQRPAFENMQPGYIRYNTDLHQFEGYDEVVLSVIEEDGNVIKNVVANWTPLTGDPVGGGTDKIFHLSERVMHFDYTIPEGHNAMVAGDLEMSEDVTLTIQPGTKLTIV